MKKILFMCCFLVGMTAICHAQGGMRRTPEERAKEMQTQLKLTDDQTAKITAVFATQRTKMDSVRTAANGDRDAMMQAMRPMMQATNDQIKAILSPDQMTAYTKYLEEQRAKRQQGGN